MYSTADATKAMFQFHIDRGVDENQIVQPSGDGYDDDDGYTFVNRDADEEEVFAVEFTDDDGNAEVTFPDGTSGTVNIRDEDEED